MTPFLMIHRGVVPMKGTYYCPDCSWCEIADGNRQKDDKVIQSSRDTVSF